MSKKNKSTGAVLVLFLRVLITIVLILILAGSVTANIAFYNKNKPVEVNINLPFYKNHSTYFINNSGDLNEIEKGALVVINPELTPAPGVYVLCTIGKDYKTILAITEANSNDNGTVSYVLKGTKEGSTISHTVSAYKIQGTVTQQNVWLGDLIQFARSMGGIAAFMAIPAFLLILICVVSIKKNKSRYEDDILESEILIEELRKIKKIEDKKKNTHVAEKQHDEAEAESDSPEETTPEEAAPELPSPSEPQSDDDSSMEDEMNQKAMKIKNAMHNQIANEGKKTEEPKYDKNPSANEIMNQMSDEMKKPARSAKSQDKQDPFENYISLRSKDTDKGTDQADVNDDQVYQQQMAQLQAKQQQMEKLRQAKPVKQSYEQPPVQPVSQAPAYQPTAPQAPVYEQPVRQYSYQPEEPKAPVYQEPAPQQYSQPVNYYQSARPTPVKKKHKKQPSQKINADSFDDLIKMLDNEKKKLD